MPPTGHALPPAEARILQDWLADAGFVNILGVYQEYSTVVYGD